MLSDILEKKACFKLVCGAGNEDAQEVEKLVALYARAGANYFDLSAREDVVLAAQRGLERALPKARRGECFLNVSVGIKGDPHIAKAVIDEHLCTRCGLCRTVCPQNAIDLTDGRYAVVVMRCIGCGACVRECPEDAIDTWSQTRALDEVLPPLVRLGLDSIELHAVSDDHEGVAEQWRVIERCFDGMLSLCIDRSRLSDRALVGRIKELISGRRPFSTIVQADGAPMSGCDDLPGTTLQALATAQIVERAKLPVWLMLSGGTNSRTAALAKTFGIAAHGVALGSYARMIVREQIDRDDFLDNPAVFGEALKTARALVRGSLRHMGTAG